MYINVAIEIDACGLPDDVEEYCIGEEISTHYDPGMALCDPSDEDDLLAKWIVEQSKEEGFDLSKFTRADGCLRVFINPT